MRALQMPGRSTAASALALALALLLAVPAEAASPDGTISTIAGSGVAGSGGDGLPATSAQLEQPRDVDVASDGTVYVTDTRSHRIRRIGNDGVISAFAGTGEPSVEGEPSGDGGPATAATMTWPHDVAVDHATGIVYIADSNNHRIRAVGLDGTISTVAGTGVRGDSGDGGPATQAEFRNPKGVDVAGRTLYVADTRNHRIRAVDLDTGIITTIAGKGTPGFTGDGGPATEAMLDGPQRLHVGGPAGEVFVADSRNHRIRRIDVHGTITTVVGTGVAGSSGDGGPATGATISNPKGLVVDGETDLYLSDSSSHRVRHVDLVTGTIRALAGTGERGWAGDGGRAADARLYDPRGLALDPAGALLIADMLNNVVRSVAAEGQVAARSMTGIAARTACASCPPS